MLFCIVFKPRFQSLEFMCVRPCSECFGSRFDAFELQKGFRKLYQEEGRKEELYGGLTACTPFQLGGGMRRSGSSLL